MDHHHEGSIRLVLAVCCWVCAAVSFLGIFLFAWLLKDGLGPDSVASQGWLALGRCFKSAGLSLLIPFAFLVSGLILQRSHIRWDA